ncbi:MAG TPA: cytochrome c biogenesis protein CcdA [Candidatus Limnocylindria bacterium]|nr:cytochrome c biogenesis protein CcdA [Candidatus Limnocylindria bacterium]
MGELAIALSAGVGATITPCVLPLYPGFLAYLTAAQPVTAAAGEVPVAHARPSPAVAAVLVWLGVVIGMVAIGAVLAALSLSLGSVLRVALPIIDLVLIGLGIMLLAGRNPFTWLPQASPRALGNAGPLAGSFVYGLFFAPIALPCSGPFLIGIFVASLTLGDAARQLAFFGAFGVGFGLPLFVLGVIGQARASELARAAIRWERPLQVVMGALLVVIGAWDLWVNLPRVLG